MHWSIKSKGPLVARIRGTACPIDAPPYQETWNSICTKGCRNYKSALIHRPYTLLKVKKNSQKKQSFHKILTNRSPSVPPPTTAGRPLARAWRSSKAPTFLGRWRASRWARSACKTPPVKLLDSSVNFYKYCLNDQIKSFNERLVLGCENWACIVSGRSAVFWLAALPAALSCQI